MRTRPLVAFLLLATALPAFAFDRRSPPEDSNPVLQKPATTRLEAFHRRDHIRVKFNDGLMIRVRNGRLTDLGTGALVDAQATLARFADGVWNRAHTVSEERLAELCQNARGRIARRVADLNLQFDLKLPAGVSAEEAIDAFNALSIVEIADAAQNFAPPPLPPDFQPLQRYLRHAPMGLSVENAWGFSGGTGNGIKVCDIEYSFNPAHADLPPVTMLGATVVDPFNSPQHGTAVIGAMGAVSNGFGMTGMVHGASYYFAGANTVNGYHIDAAILAAVAVFSPGDVIVIEQQAFGPNNSLVPAEWDVTVYNAIQTAVGNGIVVVEAGANGGQDLDAPQFSTRNNGHWPFLPQNDSGAIIVGAGASPLGINVDRSRLSFSSYGSTVDLQGWGEQVATTGFGAVYSAEGTNQYYTATFSGTSSATPLVAGACVAVQAVHKARTGTVLTPIQLRDLLRATGAAQTNGTFPSSQQIGPRPDITAAIQALGDASAITYCAGDGRATACPCANDAPSASGRGCKNSLSLGSSLVARGSASLAGDSFSLLASSLAPTATLLFCQSTGQENGGAGTVFGDGLLCVSGTCLRLGIAFADADGTAVYPASGQLPISARGLITAPGARHYQVIYRDNAEFCTADRFSHTNGVTVSWTP
ncbi:MAG: S8 family serine peptidase [Planctomycetes bacterium]|nr:S8 family serine peptidase [Planctomycetota bacterium]